MYACPNCRSSTIGFISKWRSRPALPVMCRACGAHACIATVDASAALALAAVLVTLSGFASVALGTLLPLASGLAVAVAWYVWRQHRAALVRVSKQELANARRSDWLTMLIAAIVVLLQ